MVRKLFYTFVLLSAFSQIKAQVIDSCNTQIQIQIELVIKNVLPLDSLCSYISDENNRITLIFCFDDNFNIDKVEIHTKASFNALHISSFQEELKKMKRSFKKNELEVGQKERKLKYNKVTKKLDDVGIEDVEDRLDQCEESFVYDSDIIEMVK